MLPLLANMASKAVLISCKGFNICEIIPAAVAAKAPNLSIFPAFCKPCPNLLAIFVKRPFKSFSIFCMEEVSP